MNKKRFYGIAVIVVVILAVCAITMAVNADHTRFLESMKALMGK